MANEDEVNHAILHCINVCRQREEPLDLLAEELGRLFASRRFAGAEINTITQAVLHALTSVLQPPKLTTACEQPQPPQGLPDKPGGV